MSEDLKIGEMVAGKYRVEGLIGSGGMGRVYAALHEEIGQKVALKVLRKEVSEVAGVNARFIREAKAVVSLSSEHVGRVFDVGILANQSPYIVMERLTGDTLGKMLREGPIALSTCATILAQICDALVEAHGLGIVHRDVKPANIFVTVRHNGRIHAKILDFGISKARTEGEGDGTEGLTTTGTALGTPQYMSPEQMSDAAMAGPPTDVWALGITLYFALTKKHPFESTNPLGLAVKVANEAHIPLANVAQGIHPAIHDLIDRCLDKDPKQRPTVAEFADVLEAFTTRTASMSSPEARLSASQALRFADVAPSLEVPHTSETQLSVGAPQRPSRAVAAPSQSKVRGLLFVPLLLVGTALVWFGLSRKPADDFDRAGGGVVVAPAPLPPPQAPSISTPVVAPLPIAPVATVTAAPYMSASASASTVQTSSTTTATVVRQMRPPVNAHPMTPPSTAKTSKVMTTDR
jgi:eukaryotic-like serine/threonine-protein kinase